MLTLLCLCICKGDEISKAWPPDLPALTNRRLRCARLLQAFPFRRLQRASENVLARTQPSYQHDLHVSHGGHCQRSCQRRKSHAHMRLSQHLYDQPVQALVKQTQNEAAPEELQRSAQSLVSLILGSLVSFFPGSLVSFFSGSLVSSYFFRNNSLERKSF